MGNKESPPQDNNVTVVVAGKEFKYTKVSGTHIRTCDKALVAFLGANGVKPDSIVNGKVTNYKVADIGNLLKGGK